MAGWYDKRIEKIKQLSKCHLLCFITAKVLAGVAFGLLLAMWLPVWMWWIFLIIGLLVAIPTYKKLL